MSKSAAVVAAKAPAAPAAADHTAAWLEFWGKVIPGVAWPIVILVLAVIFARPLGRLLLRLTQWKGFGVEASFREEAAQLVAATAVGAAATAETDGAQRKLPRLGREDTMGDVARAGRELSLARWEKTPRDIVDRAWAVIDEYVRGTAAALGLPANALSQSMVQLRNNGFISQETMKNIQAARQLQLHGHRYPDELDASGANLYIAMAMNILSSLANESGIAPQKFPRNDGESREQTGETAKTKG